ncbi:hypothetical protein K474DRAFT_1664032 [Panus rudis PR-1116 ss-1]|nr:hypothetical protein K474DRAFT_1664032 [Panus rudis PR-1116 ss-1]
MAEVDTLIASSADLAMRVERCLNQFERRFLLQSELHGHLLRLKYLYGHNPVVDQSYHSRREKQLDRNRGRPNAHYRIGFENIIAVISSSNDSFLQNGCVNNFLDLGCAPGGFSNWLLGENPSSNGYGITLPDDAAPGRLKFTAKGTALEDTSRYTIRFDDLTTIVKQFLDDGEPPVIPPTAGHGDENSTSPSYDLVIAGAFPTLEGHLPWWYRTRLALSQIYIALFNLQAGGSCIVVVNTKPFRWIVEVIGILRSSFETVKAAKGPLHKERSSCYLVCRNYHATEEQKSRYITYFSAALTQLQSIAERSAASTILHEGNAEEDVVDGLDIPETWEGRREPGVELPSLSGRSDDEIFEEEGEFVLDLFQPQWKDQYDEIYKRFKGVLDLATREQTTSPPPSPVSPRSERRRSSSSWHLPSSSPSGSDSGDWRREPRPQGTQACTATPGATGTNFGSTWQMRSNRNRSDSGSSWRRIQ